MSPTTPSPSRGRTSDLGLCARDVSVSFDGRTHVLEQVSLDLVPGTITAIVGPNGSGKSTLLRTLGRLRPPQSGAVLLDGRDVFAEPPRVVARAMGVLPQSPVAPDGLTVIDLVARGRDPHRRWFDQWSRSDAAVVHEALGAVGLDHAADTPLETLSGGQRQRAWLAMAIAQQASTILLDEPTTFLDVAHQLDVLELVRSLNRERAATIVMVLHDLSMAAQYADRVVALRDGAVVADGRPGEVITRPLLRTVFDLEAEVVPAPGTGRPHVLPVRRAGRSPARGSSSGPAPGLA